MLFSVPRESGGYRYYRSAGLFEAPLPPSAPLSGLGIPVDEAAPNLPPDAVFIGEGEHAQGTIARGGGLGSGLLALGLVGTALYLIFKR